MQNLAHKTALKNHCRVERWIKNWGHLGVEATGGCPGAVLWEYGGALHCLHHAPSDNSVTGIAFFPS